MPMRLTPAVKGILIACVAAFLIQQTADQFFGGNLLGWFGLIPAAFAQGKIWQLFTYPFLHADVMHLFLNMLMLVFIGAELEAVWGSARFLRFYFLCSSAGGLLYLILQMFVWKGEGLHVPMVGASGAIYGLLMAYGLLFGERMLLFMLLFPMKAKYFVWILAALQLFTTVFSGRQGLSGAAHLGGMAAGFGYLWIRASLVVAKKSRIVKKWMDPDVAKKMKRRKASKLKLVIDNEKGKSTQPVDDDIDGNGPKTWH